MYSVKVWNKAPRRRQINLSDGCLLGVWGLSVSSSFIILWRLSFVRVVSLVPKLPVSQSMHLGHVDVHATTGHISGVSGKRITSASGCRADCACCFVVSYFGGCLHAVWQVFLFAYKSEVFVLNCFLLSE
jgi:hypothetical protein